MKQEYTGRKRVPNAGHIILPRRRYMELGFGTKLDGYFECEAGQLQQRIDLDAGGLVSEIEVPGSQRDLGLHHNTILDNALEFYGGTAPATQMGVCSVGTSNQAESITDKKLIAHTAYAGFGGYGTSDKYAYSSGSAPYWGALRQKARFNPGFGGGDINLREMAVGDSLHNTNETATSRALTRDGAGDPTDISVLANEYLDVWYTRRIYPDHIIEISGAPDDGTGVIDIDGINYDYAIRPSVLTTTSFWGRYIDSAFSIKSGTSPAPSDYLHGYYYEHPATLGAVTNTMSTAGSSTGIVYTWNNRLANYTPFSYNRTAIWSSELDNANFTNGWGGIQMRTSFGAYQMKLSSVVGGFGVPKDSESIFEIYCNWAWTRKTI